jgi:hypothetical protein
MFLNSWRKKTIEKRSYKRIPKHLDIKILNGNSQHNGLVTNLSENSMYFITDANLSCGLKIEVSIAFNEDNLVVPFKVVRRKKNGLYDGFAAELSSPCQDYIHSFKPLL